MDERNERFDDWLDGVIEDYQLGNLTFRASDVLFNCDPIAYRCELSDWLDEHGEDEDQDIMPECYDGSYACGMLDCEGCA